MSSRGLGSNAQLRVTPSDLQVKSASISKLVAQMRQQYSQLSSTISKTSSYWTGEGANAHKAKFNEQKSDVEEMFNRINEHIVDLQKMAGVYTSAEADVKEVIKDSLPSDVII